jgi:hypothetical protein
MEELQADLSRSSHHLQSLLLANRNPLGGFVALQGVGYSPLLAFQVFNLPVYVYVNPDL